MLYSKYMETNHNKRMVIWSSILFSVHALEELVTRFYDIDLIIGHLVGLFGGTELIVFIALQLLLIIFLVIAYKRTNRLMLSLLGVLILFELEHIFRTIMKWQYYPGVVTGTLFLPLGFFYWKMLISTLRKF